jgi:hypothetical protein
VSTATKRPPVIDLAVRLSWISLLLGTFYTVSIAQGVAANDNGRAVLVAGVCTSVIMILAIFGIAKGRNWARILSALLFVLGVYGVASRLDEIVLEPVVWLAVEIAIYLLDAYVLFLLYSRPGASWFKCPNTTVQKH